MRDSRYCDWLFHCVHGDTMTYIRSKIINGAGPYYYEVRSVREGDKVRQEFVRYLGTTGPEGSKDLGTTEKVEARKDLGTTEKVEAKKDLGTTEKVEAKKDLGTTKTSKKYKNMIVDKLPEGYDTLTSSKNAKDISDIAESNINKGRQSKVYFDGENYWLMVKNK